MTRISIKDEETKEPLGFAYFETGKSTVHGDGFKIYFTAKFEMDKGDRGWFSVGFNRFEYIKIYPEADEPFEIQWPNLIKDFSSWGISEDEMKNALALAEVNAEAWANDQRENWP